MSVMRNPRLSVGNKSTVRADLNHAVGGLSDLVPWGGLSTQTGCLPGFTLTSCFWYFTTYDQQKKKKKEISNQSNILAFV